MPVLGGDRLTCRAELRYVPLHEPLPVVALLEGEQRDRHAARRFLRRLVEISGRKPLRATTDHHPAYRKAICWILGRKVQHRTSRYLNNFIEQDHRAVKPRYYPMRGFG